MHPCYQPVDKNERAMNATIGAIMAPHTNAFVCQSVYVTIGPYVRRHYNAISMLVRFRTIGQNVTKIPLRTTKIYAKLNLN